MEVAADRSADRGGAVISLGELIESLSPELRAQALTHSSWAEKRVSSWGRLAFLGDSVLGLTVAEALYERYPRSDIGRLTKVHGQAVSGRACAQVAVELGVPEMLRDNEPERVDGGIESAELIASERARCS